MGIPAINTKFCTGIDGNPLQRMHHIAREDEHLCVFQHHLSRREITAGLCPMHFTWRQADKLCLDALCSLPYNADNKHSLLHAKIR